MDNETEMKLLLGILEKWCRNLCVMINTSKTKIMHFRKKRSAQTTGHFMINGENVEIVESYRYLGIDINCNADPSHSSEILAYTGSHALGQLIGKTRSNFNLGYRSYTSLLDATVLPIVDNALEGIYRDLG